MRILMFAGIGVLALGGCVAGSPTSMSSAPPTPPVYSTAGLERVLGQDAAALTALFGQPDLDVREEPARKLQYASGICVLDAYLYPPAKGGEARVTYLDARQPDGTDIDRASCVAALVRRKGGK